MVTKYGMSDVIGPIVVDGAASQTMFGGSVPAKNVSGEIMKTIDAEVKAIITEAEQRAQKVIDDYRDAFVEIAETLLEVETLEQEAYNKIIQKYGIPIKELPKA